MLHLDGSIALARHFGLTNPVALRVRVTTSETFEAEVRMLKREYGIL